MLDVIVGMWFFTMLSLIIVAFVLTVGVLSVSIYPPLVIKYINTIN